MSWSVTLPGQPPTLNKLYRPIWRTAKDGRSYPSIVKSKEAELWLQQMAMIIHAARPSGWWPEGQIRLRIRLFLANDIDADNVLKVLSDAIQTGISLNDRRFLPCIESKELVPLRDARVEVVLEEAP